MDEENRTTEIGDATTRLGIQPVSKLLIAFSIPAVASTMINAIYNILARVFVGRIIGEAALGGLSLALPIMTVLIVLPVLFSIGAANFISIRLGEGNINAAQDAANHSIWLSIISGVAVTVLGYVFLEQILSLLGAEEGSESLIYCRDYIRVLLIGSVVQYLALSLANIIRSQGYPAAAMTGFLISIGVNIALLYSFVFRWGVTGCAMATVIAQIAMLAWYLIFYKVKQPTLRISPFGFKLSFRMIVDIVTFGSPQAASQLALAFLIAFYNARASHYGSLELAAEHGGDVALSAMSICTSLGALVNTMVMGLSMGAQPILGYNHGAKKYDRVTQTFKTAVLIASVVSIGGFVGMFFFTREFIALFAPDGTDTLVNFTIVTMRTVAIGLPVIGFQVVSAGFFAAVGKPKTSLFLSLSRQAIFFVPIVYILSELWGLMGVVIGSPVSDISSSILTVFVIAHAFRKQKREAPLQIES
jgi:putative MATE family efflux protein